jgi:low affinity Fe/Cu permease
MPYPDYVQANLEIQFNEVDKMYANDDLRVFGKPSFVFFVVFIKNKLGRDTNRIFKEIDVIRRKQIELATEHISLESIDDISYVTKPFFKKKKCVSFKQNKKK